MDRSIIIGWLRIEGELGGLCRRVWAERRGEREARQQFLETKNV